MDNFKEIMSIKELERELKERGLSHYHYKYYASDKRINQILSEKAIYLSDGSNWNDCCDGMNFLKNRNTLFAKSFSFLKEENVSMWMLYGNQCQGSMVDFKRTHIKRIIDENKDKSLQIGYFENEKFIVFKVIKPTDLFLIDICYEGHSRSSNRSNIYWKESHSQVAIDNNCRWFVKDYAWRNEFESRLIVSLPEKISKRGLFVKLAIPELVINDLKSRCICGPSNKESEFQESRLTNKVDWHI